MIPQNYLFEADPFPPPPPCSRFLGRDTLAYLISLPDPPRILHKPTMSHHHTRLNVQTSFPSRSNPLATPPTTPPPLDLDIQQNEQTCDNDCDTDSAYKNPFTHHRPPSPPPHIQYIHPAQNLDDHNTHTCTHHHHRSIHRPLVIIHAVSPSSPSTSSPTENDIRTTNTTTTTTTVSTSKSKPSRATSNESRRPPRT